MHGLGNDYIYVNTQQYPILNPVAASIAWSAYHTGIGSDGLVLIGPSDEADFSMRIFNADGSEAMMCGNATRCIGKYVYENGLTNKTEMTLSTLSGIKKIKLHLDNNRIGQITVDMGQPRFVVEEQCPMAKSDRSALRLQTEKGTYEGTFVSMGNPHFVIFVDDISKVDLPVEGPLLEKHEAFPQRVNVEFVQPLPDGSLRMRVWERGSGITQACGTGACATAVAAQVVGKAGQKSLIRMDGGELEVEWNQDENTVYMTGSATKVFDGEIEIDE